MGDVKSLEESGGTTTSTVSRKSSNSSLPLPRRPSRDLRWDQSNPPLSKKVKLLTCAAVFYGNIGLALVCHVHGPALTSFQKKYKTDDKTISIVFSLMTAGIASGALLSGILFRFVNRQLAIIFFFGGMGVCMFFIPFCPNITIFFIISTIMGIFGGFYASAQFTWILEMMQSECPPYVIAEHFFYAFGIIISSLLLAPFLDKGEAGDGLFGGGLGEHMSSRDVYNTSQVQGYLPHRVLYKFNSTISSTSTTFPPPSNSSEFISRSEDGEENKLIIPFTIMAIILELAMVFQLILFIFCRYYPPPPEEETEENLHKKEDGLAIEKYVGNQRGRRPSTVSATAVSITEEPDKPYYKRILLIFYLGIFCGSFKGMEDNVVAFLPKYAQNGPLHMSESLSAYLLSASMLAYNIARFLGIFIVYKIPPRAVLLCNMALTIIANILLMTYAQDNETVLWVTAVIFGVGFSTAYGCFSAYLERYLQVTDAVGSWVLLYGAGIAAVYPILIGAYIEHYPIILGYTGWVSIGICSTVLIAASIQTRMDPRRY